MSKIKFFLMFVFSLAITIESCAMHEMPRPDGTMLNFSGARKYFVQAKTPDDLLKKQCTIGNCIKVQIYALSEDIADHEICFQDAKGIEQRVRVCKPNGDIYIRFKPSIPICEQASVLSIFNLRLMEIVRASELRYVRTRCNSVGANPVRLAAELQHQPEVAFCEPDFDGTPKF